jgi:hypothetical protein
LFSRKGNEQFFPLTKDEEYQYTVFKEIGAGSPSALVGRKQSIQLVGQKQIVSFAKQ